MLDDKERFEKELEKCFEDQKQEVIKFSLELASASLMNPKTE
jgi:hypothetical protein